MIDISIKEGADNLSNLSTSLELEFRLLESHIIKKQIVQFRKNNPNIPHYKNAIDKEIKKADRKEIFFKIFYYGGISAFVFGMIGIVFYFIFYTDFVIKEDIQKNNKFLSYPKYVKCMEVMKTSQKNDMLNTVIRSICERSVNYATIEDLKNTKISKKQILDNCLYSKITNKKNVTSNVEDITVNFPKQCATISKDISFSNLFYKDYFNIRFRSFIDSWRNTKNSNYMT